MEEVDLDAPTREWIERVFANLESISHYQLLDVAPTADKKTIKAAYFRLVNLVHTDRYFGKKLGSYKPKMESIFARLSEAYAVLSNDEKRAKYGIEDGDARGVKAPLDPRTAAKRQAAMDALKARFDAGRGKAKELAEKAARARAAGDVMTAAECYRQAMQYAPNDHDLKAAYQQVQSIAASKLVDAHRSRAVLEERFGKWSDAAASWQRVVEAKPDDMEAHARLAQALARAARGS